MASIDKVRVGEFQLPDGRIAEVEIPAGMSVEEARAQVEAQFSGVKAVGNEFNREEFIDDYNKELNESLSTPEKMAVGYQRGLMTNWRGITGEKEDPYLKKAGEALDDSSTAAMLSNVVGTAAPYVPVALATGGASLLPRIIASGTLGGAEGLIVSRGSGSDQDTQAKSAGLGAAIGGGLEAIFPVIGRLGRKIYAKLGRTPKGSLIDQSGNPTPDFAEALEQAGTTMDELTEEAIDLVARQSSGARPADAERLARFESLDIPASRGNVTQDFRQQATEERLASMATGLSGEPLRQLRLDQSEAFVARVDDLVAQLGVPDRAGEAIKGALTGRQTLLRNQKNSLYKKAAETSEEVANIPLFADTLAEALPDAATMRRLGRIEGGQVKALQDLLVEFGIDRSDDAVRLFAESGGEVIPLTLGNLEEFRGALNQIIRADKSGAASVAAGPVLRALDGEADEVAKALGDAGVDVGEDLMRVLRDARQTTRQLKTEFSPESITGRMIATKRDGITPVVEASRVFRELETKPVEQVERVMHSLYGAGDEGKAAIGDIKAAVVFNALEAGLKAPSRKTDGIVTVGGNQFAKYLDKLGEDRLRAIFKGDDAGLRRLMMLRQTALDTTSTARAIPQGSAPVILDLVNRFGRMPGLAAVVDVANLVIKAGADDRAVRKALKASPEKQRVINQLEEVAPSLASALGIAVYATQEGDE